MTTTGWIFLIIGILALVIFLLWLVLGRFYKRSTKETAFVRTGFGGQKVVMNGGALVFPVLHEIIPVNMGAMRLGVSRANEQALITLDFMRVNVQAEFYVRVKPTLESIANAAQTLGVKTMNPDALKTLVEGKFVDMLRAVAAMMTMEEIHQQRIDFVRKVQAGVAEDLVKNGLELESVSLTELDQTDQKFFNPQNAFDARGLTALTEEIQTRRRLRNVIELDTEVAIRKKNLEAERQKLDLSKEEEFARLEQQLNIEVRRAEQHANIAREQVEKEQQAKEAQIAVKQRLDQLQIQAEQAVEEERIARERLLKEKDIAKEKTIAAAEIEKESSTQEAQIKAKQFLDQVQVEAKQRLDQVQIAAEKAVEEERIARDLFLREKEIARAEAIEAAEVEKDRIIREAQIIAQQILEQAQVVAKQKLDQVQIEAKQRIDQAQIAAEKAVEEERISRDQFLKEKDLNRAKAVEAAEVEKDRIIKEAQIAARQILEQAQIAAEREIEEAKITSDILVKEKEITRQRIIELAEIEQQKAVSLAEQDRAIALVQKSKEHAAAQTDAERARMHSVQAEERVITTRQVEIAERQKTIDLIEAQRKAERDATAVIVAAEARKKAALEQAAADKTLSDREAEKVQIAAQAEAEAETVRMEAAKKRYSVEAAGARALHEAENILTSDVISMKVKMEIIKHLSEIIHESVKPIETIEGIKIFHVDGLNMGGWGAPSAPGGGDVTPGGGGNLADQLVNSLLRYRGQAPLVDAILKEIGLKGGDIHGLTEGLRLHQTPPSPETEQGKE